MMKRNSEKTYRLINKVVEIHVFGKVAGFCLFILVLVASSHLKKDPREARKSITNPKGLTSIELANIKGDSIEKEKLKRIINKYKKQNVSK